MGLVRRQRNEQDIWPGFVDALASVLMVIMFLLLVFIFSQFFLSEEISDQDREMRALNARVAELADLLALERDANVVLRNDLADNKDLLSASLQKQKQAGAIAQPQASTKAESQTEAQAQAEA